MRCAIVQLLCGCLAASVVASDSWIPVYESPSIVIEELKKFPSNAKVERDLESFVETLSCAEAISAAKQFLVDECGFDQPPPFRRITFARAPSRDGVKRWVWLVTYVYPEDAEIRDNPRLFSIKVSRDNIVCMKVLQK